MRSKQRNTVKRRRLLKGNFERPQLDLNQRGMKWVITRRGDPRKVGGETCLLIMGLGFKEGKSS